jgi:hypothetical protein
MLHLEFPPEFVHVAFTSNPNANMIFNNRNGEDFVSDISAVSNSGLDVLQQAG